MWLGHWAIIEPEDGHDRTANLPRQVDGPSTAAVSNSARHFVVSELGAESVLHRRCWPHEHEAATGKVTFDYGKCIFVREFLDRHEIFVVSAVNRSELFAGAAVLVVPRGRPDWFGCGA